MLWRTFLGPSAVLLVACGLLSACSRHAWQDAGADAPAALDGAAIALPPLATLPEAARGASLIGPGFFPLNVLAPVDEAGTAVSGDELLVFGDSPLAEPPAYALYGLAGFEPGVGPTSARLTASAVIGEYFVAFADYGAGRWRLTGPFTDSATAEIPAGGTPAPPEWLSPGGSAYFAVLCGSGNSVQLSAVELGLQGGGDAPAPVTFGRYTGQTPPYVFIWTRSTDEADLDFGGYIVERAPELDGDFVRLTEAPVREHYYIDDTASAGEKYRIRVAAVDVSGNQSAWYELSGPSDEPADPVCILKRTPSPFDAPLRVTFDLSESFDPLGQDIIEYNVTTGNKSYTGTEPLINVLLEPGCYSIGASIITADFRYGSDVDTLKAYPQWQAQPVIVRNTSTAADACWDVLQLHRDESSGRLALCARDSRWPGVSLWQENDGGGLDMAVLPEYSTYGYYHQPEPLLLDGQPHFILQGYEGRPLGLAVQDSAQQASYAYLSAPDIAEGVLGVFTGADGQPWAIKRGRLGGDYYNDFVAAPLSDPTAETLIYDGHELSHFVVLAQNPQTGTLHILGSSASQIPDYYAFYAEFDPASLQNVVAEDLPGLFTFDTDSDLEVVPATNELWLAFYDNDHVSTRQRSGGMWQPPVAVDDSGFNDNAYDLELGAGGPCTMISLGRPRLYEWTGAAWAMRNEVTYTADVASEIALSPIPASDDFVAASIASTGELYIAELYPDGSDDLVHTLEPTSGAGKHLSAAADLDGIHVLAVSTPDSRTYHYYSDNGGASFAKLADQLPAAWLELTASATGAVHLSILDEAQRLCYWNGSQFIEAVEEDSAYWHFPLLSQVPEADVRWAAPMEGADYVLDLYYGNPLDGYDATSQSQTIQWTVAGVLGPQVLFPRAFCIGDYDYPTGLQQFCGLITIPGAVETKLFTPRQTAYLQEAEANGRCCAYLAAGFCYGGLGPQFGQIFWSGFGEDERPVRVAVQSDGSYQTAPLPGNWDSDPRGGMPLRSMQSAQADGFTAVCVAAGLFGDPAVLEWSNWGAWEQLPLPASMVGMSKYELCVARDGRWHLFAHDWRNDRIVCLSTVLAPAT